MRRALLLASFFMLLACSRATSTDGAESRPGGAARGALVARVGAVELREEDVRRAVERDPGAAPGRFETPEARKELLEGLVRFELLAQAADRAGFTRDPDALHALKQIAVTKLVNQELGAAASPDAITKAEVEREYRARLARDYTLPPAAHVRHIRVGDGAEAERLAARARALRPEDDEAFAALARASSQDASTSGRGGDLGFVDVGSKLPSALVQAALSLQTPGEVKGPLPTDDGFEILRLVSRRAPAVSPLSSVEEPLRQRLYRERRAAALDALIARLRRETPVQLAGNAAEQN